MTTKDQAIALAQSAADKLSFYKSEKDRTVRALRAWTIQLAQPPAPDCRTCAWQNPCKLGLDSIPDCTNGDKYEAAPKVVLWRTE